MDLEKLIAAKQDALRGRRRDWIDDAKDRLQYADWSIAYLVAVCIVLVLIGLSL